MEVADSDKADFQRWLREMVWSSPASKQTDEHPVVSVAWKEAVEFCKWLSKKDGHTYRLPTEAEWEYACRAGTTTLFYNGDDYKKVPEIAHISVGDKHQTGTVPVGKFKPNAFGLYDMVGNAAQWCSDFAVIGREDNDGPGLVRAWPPSSDFRGVNYYAKSPVDDPQGPSSGPSHICRGCSYAGVAAQCRSATRGAMGNGYYETIGFRVARTK